MSELYKVYFSALSFNLSNPTYFLAEDIPDVLEYAKENEAVIMSIEKEDGQFIDLTQYYSE